MFCPDSLELLLCLFTYIVSHTFLNEKKKKEIYLSFHTENEGELSSTSW